MLVTIDNAPVTPSCTIFKDYQTSNGVFQLHPLTGTLAKDRKVFRSTGIWYRFFGTVDSDVSQERSVVTFMNPVFFDYLTFEDEGITFLRSVGNHSPNNTESCPTRFDSSATPRGELQSNLAESENIVATDGINNNKTIKIVLHDAVHRLIKASLPSKCHMVSRYAHKCYFIDTDVLSKHGRHCVESHEDTKCSGALRAELLCRISPKSVNKYGMIVFRYILGCT